MLINVLLMMGGIYLAVFFFGVVVDFAKPDSALTEELDMTNSLVDRLSARFAYLVSLVFSGGGLLGIVLVLMERWD